MGPGDGGGKASSMPGGPLVSVWKPAGSTALGRENRFAVLLLLLLAVALLPWLCVLLLLQYLAKVKV